jgi:tRNA A37 threonylcarbamoyladenosine dehydratase
MPENPTVPSPHVQRLIDEKYDVTLHGQYIIVDNVPYVSAAGVISRAAVISPYYVENGKEHFGDHTVWFTGTAPCTASGGSLAHVVIVDENRTEVAGRQVLCRFSYKSERADTLDNIYSKLMHNIRKLQSYVNVIDAGASARGDGSFSSRQEQSVFHYPNTAIAREGLDSYEQKLKLGKIAIIGLGGTGSYILDALAKTPVREIHLYDDDTLDPATVFRMPGAISYEEAHKGMRKTDHHKDVYSRMRTGIESHPVRVDASNVHELDGCDFVFIAVDHGPSRGLIARYLSEKGISFVDVGMGVDRVPEVVKLIARVRATAIGDESKFLLDALPVAEDAVDVVYNNIQVVELNALNAMLAVVIYKQKIGFYSEEIAVNALKYVLAWQRLSHFPPKPNED